MKRNPGNWSEQLFKKPLEGATNVERNLGVCGEETMNAIMAIAQERVSQYTVIIGTAGLAKDCKDLSLMQPGSGVFVQLNRGVYGILTAGHVLRRDNNTESKVSLSILVSPSNRQPCDDVMRIDLPYRPCTVDGFDNKLEEGPDIAIIPLETSEWMTLDKWGMVAYNVEKNRWSEEEKSELETMQWSCLSIINGIRYEASQIIYSHTDRSKGSLVMMATNTQVEEATDRGEHDYLELPSELTEYSYPTHWKSELPSAAAKKIERFHVEGVTQRAWAGTSGAGVWNLAVRTDENGKPNGRVLAELAGICYFANEKKGCIIAHGKKSIRKIALRHVESYRLR